MTDQTLTIKNNNGFLKFDGDGLYNCNSTNYKINSTGFYRMEADDFILFKNTSGNLDIISDNGVLSLTSGLNTANAIVFNTSNVNGGMNIFTGSGGYTVTTSNGNIDFHAQGADINIGVSAVGTPAGQQTQNVNIESFNNLTMNSGDIYVVSSDVLSFISNTGDIQFGTSNGAPIIKFQNGNLLVNQSSSDLDRQVDIAVTDESASKPGHNGLVINTFESNVASDLTLQTSNTVSATQCILSMGAYPGNDKYAKYQTYLGYQSANVVVRLDGPAYSPNRSNQGFGYDFTYADIGKQLYWPLTDRTVTIESLGTLIIGNNDPSNVTVTGTYTGSASSVYLLQIDSANPLNPGTINTFMWSDNGGISFQKTFIPIPVGPVYLNNGIYVQFASQTGYSLYQQFIFQAKITAYVDTTEPIHPGIPDGEPFYSLQPFHAYFGTETPSDIVIKTNNQEKIRITGDGSIGIQQKNPTSCLELDSNYNKVILVNQTAPGFQINPAISQIGAGGYVIVWNNQDITIPGSPVFDVYGQYYLTDGSRYKTNFKVNNTTSDYQSFPSVAGQNVKDSPFYAVTWASNTGGTFDVYAQILHYNIPLYNTDILVGTGSVSTDLNNQLYPKVGGLYNGNFIIVWASADSMTGISTIQGRIMSTNGGFVTSQFQISASGALTSRNYPYVACLPSNDTTVPNGFVVGFMVKLDTLPDSRYTISIRMFNSNGTPYTPEIPITSYGSLSYSSISDGLLSLAEINSYAANVTDNGGFVMSFYRNYEADTTLYNISDGVIGLQSGATASISALDPVNRVMTLINVSNRFLIDEEISIASTVPGVNNAVEKIAAIDFLTTNTANITLDKGYRNVVAYRYNSNVTVASDAVWNIQVNTSQLFQDLDLINVPSNSTVFQYKRPMAAVTVNNTGTGIVSWNSGSIPSVYYQLINVVDGSLIGTEQRLTSQYDGLKQRDQVVAHLQSIQGSDFGFVISWDNQNLDLSDAGVYQQLIGFDHSIMRFEDGDNNIIFNHNGDLGIGTYNPTATLHIQTPQSNAFNDPPNPVSLTLQNTAQHIISGSTQQSITFMNGNSTVLGSIKVSNSLRYDDLYPQPNSLIGFYKFDQSTGTQVPDSSSSSTSSNLAILTYVNTNGILMNFDVENCWQAGLINNCLAYDGVNNYVLVEPTATNGLNTVLETAKNMSISVWVKVSSDIIAGSTMDIVSNDGDLSLPGTYLLSLTDVASNGIMCVTSNIIVDTSTFTLPGTDIGLVGTTQINDGNWHLINMTAQVGTGFLKLYVDGQLETSTTFSNTVTYVQHSSNATTFGVRSSLATSTFFRGYMDEFRFYDSILTQQEITQLYKYGSQVRGSIIINANDDPTLNTGIVIDDTGKINNLNSKPLPYSVLSGILTAYQSNTSITGNYTLFTQELSPGDIIVLDTILNTEFTVITVESDTQATINLRGYSGPEVSKSYQSVLLKPNIYSFFDNGDNIKGYINTYGNMIIGNGLANSLLELSGSSTSNASLPELTMTNTDIDNGSFARRTAINFAGYDSSDVLNDPINLGKIAVSHYNSGVDNKGIMQFGVNDGSSVNNVVSIISDGNIGIGGENDPIAQIHMVKQSNICTLLMQSGAPQDGSVFDEQNYLYFAGVQSITQTISPNLNSKVLCAVRGSNDSNTFNLDGRIDFMTNNLTDNTNGIESRMSITRRGYVGIGLQQPESFFQVGPELRIGDNINHISNVTSNTTVHLNNNIFINYTGANTSLALVGATVTVGNSTLLTCKIVSISSANTMVVDKDLFPYIGYTVYVNFAGLNVDKNNGHVGINTTSPPSMFSVNGSVSLPIKTITSDLTLSEDQMYYTILCDTTSGNINVTLPSHTSQTLYGRLYTIKNIGANTVNILVPGGDPALIDGASSKSISVIYNVLRIQSDNTNWWII